MNAYRESWNKFDDYVIDFAIERLRSGQKIAIVTLIKIDGASPRPVGAQMAVSESGEWVGYLSGGCIERAIVAEAMDAISAEENRVVRYGRGSKYIDIRLPCGSAIDIYFDVNISMDKLSDINEAYINRRMTSMIVGDPFGICLRRIYVPRLRLVVAGTGPAAAHLLRLARISCIECILLSPDASTRAECEREGVKTQALYSPNERTVLEADSRTAVVLMFHDHDWEDPLLAAALETEAFYLGALGSRRTHAERRSRMLERGIESAKLDRIHGPAGLFHGAKSAHAMAISIIAEILNEEGKNSMFKYAENEMYA